MFSLIYSARHKDCGALTFLSDYRFKSREDLKLHPDIKPIKMHCRQCYLEMDATHFEVVESVGLGVKPIVEETEIENLNSACRSLIIPK